MPHIPKTIDDYLVLPLTLPAIPSFPAATHYLYVRRHAPSVPTPSTPRSLFAVNLPVDATEAHLRALFAALGGGRVERVGFDGVDASATAGATTTTTTTTTSASSPASDASGRKRKRGDAEEGGKEGEGGSEGRGGIETWDRPLRRSGGCAVVVFVDRSSAEMALKAVAARAKTGGKGKGREKPKEGLPVWGEGVPEERVPPLGISRYLAHHALSYPSPTQLQSSVDSFMASFARTEAAAHRAAARRRQQPDEDGFVTVTRGGRVAPARPDEARAALERKEQKAKANDLTGFYRWQLREERKRKLVELVRRFEEDKARVAERKRERKFRPV